MAKSVEHSAPDKKAWRSKWTTDRKPKAMANGVGSAKVDDKLTVTHDVVNEPEFRAHVEEFEKAGKRKEMGAKNMPF